MDNLERRRVVRFVRWMACGLSALAFAACAYDPVKLPAGAGGSSTTQGGSSVVTGGSSNNGGQVSNGGSMVSGGVGPGGGEGNMSGAGGGGAPVPTNPNLTFTKIQLHNRFLAEAVAVGDFNKDGTLDIAAGRRWYQGPFAAGYNIAQGEHVYRDGHEDLPITGAAIEINTGVSDSWAAYSVDMNADGWDDIIQITASDMGPKEAGNPDGATSLTAGTGLWYQNPKGGNGNWQGYQISADMKGEHKALADMTGDGKPEILGACRDCNPKETWGYWEANWANPSALWTYHAVTRHYDFKDSCCGWLHGLGAGDVNGDGKLDLLERSGVWLQPAAAGQWEFLNVAFSIPEFLGIEPDIGGGNMYSYDVDGDGMNDVVTSLNSHGYGLAWFKQGPAKMFTRMMIMNTPEEKAMYGGIAVSQLHTVWLEDMDGDGLKDIITGKTWLAHPYSTGDAGGTVNDPVEFYIWKLERTPEVKFVPHLLDKDMGAEKAAGGAREFKVTDINGDGLKDIIVANKRGLFVYLGKP